MGVAGNTGIPVTSPLLTILIPTYERAERARNLAAHLLPLVESMDGKVELIVSINPAADAKLGPSRTERYLSELKSPLLQIIVQPVHYATAENHIFESLRMCRGEYVLFHGDDDLTVHATLQSLLPMLEHNRYDFIAFSSTMIDADGGDAGGRIPRMNADVVETDFIAGALSLGFMCGLAGMSNIVQRRSLLAQTDERFVLENEPIYAHVVWRLRAFRDRRMAIVNRPLVYYRGDASDAIGSHFREFAIQRGVGDFHFWGLGIIRHLVYLEREGILTADEIRTAFDFRKDGTHFRLLDNVMFTIEAQILLATRSAEARNRMLGIDLQEATDWLVRIDPAFYEPSQIVHDIYAQQNDASMNSDLPRGYVESRYSKCIDEVDRGRRIERLHEMFHKVMEHRIGTLNKYIGLIGRYRSYSIYNHLRGFVAFADERGHDCQAHLRIVDIESIDDSIVVLEFSGKAGSSFEAHLSKMHRIIDEVRARQIVERRAHSWPQLDELSSMVKANEKTLQVTLAQVHTVVKDVHFLAAMANLKKETSPPRWWRRSVVGFSYEYYKRTYHVRWFPLRHFLRIGWRKGHNPSGAFSTRGYLSANPDVAAADVNPLLHFLTYGRQERRHGWY